MNKIIKYKHHYVGNLYLAAALHIATYLVENVESDRLSLTDFFNQSSLCCL